MKLSLVAIIGLLSTCQVFATPPVPVDRVAVDGKEYPVYYILDVKKDTPPPAFPPRAREEGRGGSTEVGAIVGENGRVKGAFIKSSDADKDIQHAVVAAVRRWRFQRIKVDGAPISYVVFVTVEMRPNAP